MSNWNLRIAGALLVLSLGAPGCGSRPAGLNLSGDLVELKIKDKAVKAEVACDDTSRAVGLMGRTSLAPDAGMIFVYPKADKLGFWMKNTTIPLSIAFLDDKGAILQIEDMRPKDETRTVSTNRVRFALEVNQGWFARSGIGVGDVVSNFEAAVAPFGGVGPR